MIYVKLCASELMAAVPRKSDLAIIHSIKSIMNLLIAYFCAVCLDYMQGTLLK